MLSKKIKGLIATLSIIGLLCTPVMTAHADESLNVERVWGQDRYETAAKVADKFVNTEASSTAQWTTAKTDTVILCNGENYPDALSAAPLVRVYNAPILLTTSDSLPSITQAELNKLNIKHVVIIGGTGVVSTSIENSLKSQGMTTERFAGSDRFATSIKIANRIVDYMQTDAYKNLKVKSKGIIIVNDSDFRDALSYAPLAGSFSRPIVLIPDGTDVRASDVPGLQDLANRIKNSNSTNDEYFTGTIEGTPGVISTKIADELDIAKFSYRANKQLANLYAILNSIYQLNNSGCIMTSDSLFPDSLSATSLAIKFAVPIMFAGDDKEVAKTVQQYQFYDLVKFMKTGKIYLIGGTSVVPDNATNKLYFE